MLAAMSANSPVAVLGASGMLGRAVVARLRADGNSVIALSRSMDPTYVSWLDSSLPPPVPPDATVVGCQPVQVAEPWLRALHEINPSRRIVQMTSARSLSNLIHDPTVAAVRAADASMLHNIPSVLLLRATMIVGDGPDHNVSRLMEWAQTWGGWLRPSGATEAIQPVAARDVASALAIFCTMDEERFAQLRPHDGVLPLAGEDYYSLPELWKLVCAGIGKRAGGLPIPLGLACRVARRFVDTRTTSPFLFEMARWTENRRLEAADTWQKLGIEPTPLITIIREKQA